MLMYENNNTIGDDMSTQSPHRLWGARCYLSGAMDFAKDHGVGWRKDLTPFLESLGVIVLDPCNKPIETGLESIECMKYRRKLKDDGEYAQLAKEMKVIRCVDLRMVDMADFTIVNLDSRIQTCGTHEEYGWSNRLKNPVLIRNELGKDEISDWLFGMIPHEHMFNTWAGMKEYLLYVHTSEDVDDMKRWMFFDYSKLIPKVSIEESMCAKLS